MLAAALANGGIGVVLGKALRVLGHAELFEPVRNLLHCIAAPLADFISGLTALPDKGDKEFIRQILSVVGAAVRGHAQVGIAGRMSPRRFSL